MNAISALASLEARWAHSRQRMDSSCACAIDPDAARRILDEYDLQVNAPPRYLVSRGASTNLIVDSTLGKLVLKEYKATRELSQIIHTHSILTHLAQVGFPAPRLVPARNGSTWIQRDGATYALFHFIEGYIRYPNTFLPLVLARQTLAAAGEMMACFHDQLKDFAPQGCHPNAFQSRTGPRIRDVAWYGETLAQSVEETRRLGLAGEPSGTISILVRRADELSGRFCDLDQLLTEAALPRLIIHGDYGPHNLLYKQDAPPLLLDLEGARLDWRVADLARAMRHFCWNGFGVSLRRMSCLLMGYASRYPIADGELLLVPAVWQYFCIRWIINNWHTYTRGRTTSLLGNIQRHLWWLDWASEHQEEAREQLATVPVNCTTSAASLARPGV